MSLLTPMLPENVAASRPPLARRFPIGRGYVLPWVGGGVLAVMVLGAIFVPLVSPFGVDSLDFSAVLRAPGSSVQGHLHLFGTDELGRDILTRVFYGARFSLWISAVSVLGAFLLGTAVGLIAGYVGGLVDDVLMRICDVQLAFPLVLLALAILAALGSSVKDVMFVFILTLWPVFARTARGSTLVLREQTFVESARAVGASHTRILLKHILPNAAGPLVVVGTFQFASVIIYESALGFLGLGVQPPTPTWGNMIAEGRQYLGTSWWISALPGLMLVATTMSVNWIGDGITRVLNPRQRRQV